MKSAVLEKLRQVTGKEGIAITARGNAALLYALFIVRKKNNKATVAIPDQGGWLTYKTFPKLFGWRVVEYPTKDGKVDVDFIRAHKQKFACVLVNNPGGYAVCQPMEEIYAACDGKTMVVEDISGSIGDSCGPADIKIASFGQWKPVGVGLGGCIGTSPENLESIRELFKITRIEDDVYARIDEQLSTVKGRYDKWRAICASIRSDLSSFSIVEGNGIVVIVRYDTDEQKLQLINYCHTHEYPFTDCPRYIRIMERAICIEVKRL